MKTIRHLTLLTILTLACTLLGFAQGSDARLAILPMTSNGVDTVTLGTTESILRTEITKLSAMDVVSGRRTREALGEAVALGGDLVIVHHWLFWDGDPRAL